MKRVVKHLKNHFIPHKGNDYTPHLLKHRALLAYSGILIATKAALVIVGIAFPSASLYSFAINESNIVRMTNEARREAGLPTLDINATLRGAAQAKADDMIVRQYFSHEGPNGESPWTWLNKSGYRYAVAGENLAIHYKTAEALEQGWLASPTHRANILDKRFTEVGVGFSQGKIEGYDSMVVVQLFAAPRSNTTKPVASPVNPKEIKSEIVLKNDKLQIKIDSPEATSVSGHIGESDIVFKKEATSGTWIGQVDPKNINDASKEVYATTRAPGSEPSTELVGVLVSNDQVGELYRTEPMQPVRVLGMNINGLGDSTRKFYLITLVGLLSILVLNIFVKFHIQRPSIIAHTMAVMALALLFVFI